MANKTCLVCGTALADSAMFCSKCGTKHEPPKEEEKQDVMKAVLIRKMIYSVDEAAAALSISVRFVNKLIAEGELTPCRQGRKVGVTEWALEAYAKSREVVPTETNTLRGKLKAI